MEPVTSISGINSMGIYLYNDIKYYFFGDIHGHNLNPCDLNCDYFNYTFTETKTYNTSCTTIGPLLFNWLKYNDVHDIKTDFYIEETYESNTIYNKFNDLINNRFIENYDTLSTIFPYQDISWMELMRYLLPQLNLKNVKIHPIDIRFLNHERISPFHIQFIQPNDFKKDIINYVKILLLNYKIILKSLLSPAYNLDSLFSFIDSKLSSDLKFTFQYQLKLMNKVIVNKRHLIGDTLYQLSLQNSSMSKKIIDFILLLSDEHMNNALNDYNYYVDLFKTKMTLDEQKMTMAQFLNHYTAIFNVLAAYTMDAYVLANLFLNQNEEVIVYTGAAHTEVYHLFFQNYLNLIPIYESTNIDKKCVTFEQLPLYLNVNLYR